MYPDMPFQITLLNKLFCTMRALVPWANVNKHMFIEGVSPVKFFSTMLTFMLFLIFVTHSVIIETGFCHKTEATNWAEIRIGVRMVNLIMQAPVIGRLKYFAAHFANKALLSFIWMRWREMSLQSFLGRKFFFTHIACVGDFLVFTVGLFVLIDMALQWLLVFKLLRTVRALVCDCLWMFGLYVIR